MEDNRQRRHRIDAPSTSKPAFEQDRAGYEALHTLALSRRFSPQRAAEVTEQFPRIKERILNVANSTRFSLRQRVTNVRRALLLIGPNGLRDLTEPYLPTSDSALSSRLRE